jgi:hypothetical protein
LQIIEYALEIDLRRVGMTVDKLRQAPLNFFIHSKTLQLIRQANTVNLGNRVGAKATLKRFINLLKREKQTNSIHGSCSLQNNGECGKQNDGKTAEAN